MIRNSEIA